MLTAVPAVVCLRMALLQAEIEKVQKRREEREAEKQRMEEELVSQLERPVAHQKESYKYKSYNITILFVKRFTKASKKSKYKVYQEHISRS